MVFIDESKWINELHGMELYPFEDFQNKRHNENGILFLCEYYLLKNALGRLTNGDINRFYRICLDLRSYRSDGVGRYEGLFDRGAGESKPGYDTIRTISHDNLTAISRFSILGKLPFAKAIAEHGLDNYMVFDNARPEAPRWLYKPIYGKHAGKWTSRLQHPRDWHYWLYNGGYKFKAIWTYPIFALANIITCFGEETSGKWLMFTRLFGRQETHYKLLYKLCAFILKQKYGKNWLSAIARTYFHQRIDNPIRILARELEEKELL